MNNEKRLVLGTMIHGAGERRTDWRHPGIPSDASVNFRFYKEQAILSEKGKFDFVFVADALYITEESTPHYLNRFEPLTVLSALAAVTDRIGLVATLSSTYSEPYSAARQLASLDMISGGRAGWNAVTTGLGGTALNFGHRRGEHPEHRTRYRMAAEFTDVIQKLWDTWEDDAFPRDKGSGRFADFGKMHEARHHGEFFSVEGALNIARSPQGQPVIFQAGKSPAGRAFASKTADVVFAIDGNERQARQYYADMKARAAKEGRGPDRLLVIQGISPIVATTEAEALRIQDELASVVTLEEALADLGRHFDHHDFTQYDPDAPFPDLGDLGLNGFQSDTERIRRMAAADRLTLRETAMREAAPKTPFIGTPVQVADRIERWVRNGACDGFMLIANLPGLLKNFVDLVVPILVERGLFREEYEEETLRGHLGLAFKENRHAEREQVK
ncbi:LLM class flavin-dependent oxidoreductase [Bhargavaea cecembensis]|uniref:LLM class flavin-dependent oxidoreductase n=1 Tax=Bhargavaea cecembensis TaxID=394098 RepID=UPI00058B530A|nr:LLM class flavin-dependent oxidoreductase [Bhargavaea cecembensis]